MWVLALLLWQPAPPQAAEAWQKLGLERHLRDQYEPAMEAFTQALRRNPSLWTSHLFLGIGRYRTNQFAPALESLRTANKLAPPSGEGRDEIDFWLGAAQVALNKPLAGLKDLERLLARRPNHVDALQLAARTYADLSSAFWNEVAERHPDSAPGWEVHGHAMESEGNIPAALDAYRKSRSLAPKRAGPAAAIGRLLLTQGKAAEALAALGGEADPESLYHAGLAATQLGRNEEAARFLEPASRWFADAALALAQVYLALADPVNAAAAARRALDADPTSAAARDLLQAALARSR